MGPPSPAVSAPSRTIEEPLVLPAGIAGERLSGVPVGLAEVDGRPWVAVAQGPYLRMPDGRHLTVGAVPLRLAPAGAGVWVSVFGDGEVALISADGERIVRRVSLGRSSQPEGLAVVGDRLYVVDQAGARVVALDATSGRVLDEAPVGSGPRLLAAGAAALWVTNFNDDSVTRIDLTATGELGRRRTIPVCRGPQGIVVAFGRAWVACTIDGVVAAIDPRTSAQSSTVADAPLADAVLSVGERLVAIGQQGPTAYVIDPEGKRVVGRLAVDTQGGAADGNVDAVVIGPDMWVTHPTPGRLYRVPVSALP